MAIRLPVQKQWTKNWTPSWPGKGQQSWGKGTAGEMAALGKAAKGGYGGGFGYDGGLEGGLDGGFEGGFEGGLDGGFGKGGGAGPPSKMAVPPDFQVDEVARYLGTVTEYWKTKGYGWISMVQSGVAPGDKVFVYWKAIQSDDRYPMLVKNMEVEFGLQIWTANGQRTLRAKDVTQVGGANVAVQDAEDAETKAFVGGQFLRYTGMLDYFSPQSGLGKIQIDEGFALDESVPKELSVETMEVNAGGQRPQAMRNIQVEFGIWQTGEGEYKAYNMTLPGGLPLTPEALPEMPDLHELQPQQRKHNRHQQQQQQQQEQHHHHQMQHYEQQQQEQYYEQQHHQLAMAMPVKQGYSSGRRPPRQPPDSSMLAGQIFTGTIAAWNFRREFGYIATDPSVVYPPEIQEKMDEMIAATKAKGKPVVAGEKPLYFRKQDCQPGFFPDKGLAVCFQVYTDDKGAGAFDVAGA